MEGLAQPDKRKEIVNRVIPLGAIVAHPRNYQQHPDSRIQTWVRRARNVHPKGGHPDRLPVVEQAVKVLLEGEKLMVELNRAEKARSASASNWLGFEVLK